MGTDFSQIEQFALALPELDRAKLAGTLLRSLPPTVDDDPQLVAAEWADVILARSGALHRGETQFVDGEAVEEDIADLWANISNAPSADK